jgi:hypothetical protein
MTSNDADRTPSGARDDAVRMTVRLTFDPMSVGCYREPESVGPAGIRRWAAAGSPVGSANRRLGCRQTRGS